MAQLAYQPSCDGYQQDDRQKTLEVLDRSEAKAKETQQALDEARSQLEDLNAGESGKESL